MSQFESGDLDNCRLRGHALRITGSDKSPLKKSLCCQTCSIASGRNVYVAYGFDKLSWGQWGALKAKPVTVEDVEI